MFDRRSRRAIRRRSARDGRDKRKRIIEHRWATTVSGVTILLSLTVFLNLVAETLPQVSDAIPLLGTTEFLHRANVRERNPTYFRSAATCAYSTNESSPECERRTEIGGTNLGSSGRFGARPFSKRREYPWSISFYAYSPSGVEKMRENASKLSFVRSEFLNGRANQ